MKKIFTLFILLFSSLLMLAQAPQKLSYQCVIRNASGELITNKSIGIKISILQGSPVGTTVFSETYSPNPQTNVNGLLSLEIGGGVPVTGTFSGINWDDGPYFIKTETDPNGGTSYTITGTSQLLSVPYALNAGNVFSGDYNDLTNKPSLFNGTFSALTGKPTTLSGYGITDAMSTSHPAYGISGSMISNWNTAYGWGNHATAGYAKYPSQTGNGGKYLKTNGSSTYWSVISPTLTSVQGNFQFVTYKPGSSAPIAFGFINSNGSVASSSGNVSCTWSGSRYEITITGESYFYNSYITVITLCDPRSTMVMIRTDSASGKLLVYLSEGVY